MVATGLSSASCSTLSFASPAVTSSMFAFLVELEMFRFAVCIGGNNEMEHSIKSFPPNVMLAES